MLHSRGVYIEQQALYLAWYYVAQWKYHDYCLSTYPNNQEIFGRTLPGKVRLITEYNFIKVLF